jgi:hypothetical protein
VIFICLYITDPEDRTEQHFATSGESGTVHILQRLTECQSALMCMFHDLGIASYSFIIYRNMSQSLCTFPNSLLYMPFTKALRRLIYGLRTPSRLVLEISYQLGINSLYWSAHRRRLVGYSLSPILTSWLGPG